MAWNLLTAQVINWAQEREIFVKSDTHVQALKFFEEAGEMSSALIKDDQAKFVDGVGDVLVTLTLLCQMRSVTLEECLEEAWNEIKTRKGRMIGGVFVKEADFATGGSI